ncbi:hypothetical protein SmJEL517_g05317 [Synchytrium microbalum]|uniref:1-phosphatidylinositol-3-phosphate 5-kinase n=1 Tax=Synchytrium microbalum TaxID=1806994 RepID=A0A507C1C0_9FUNG|nr:uncharacterized protein SmJEL517_g05317 [Synchytrium microbalum]TPX31303.1 hypothetical protein SmJEL517_g05317 [Synchytrium microbalum]
MNTIRRLRSREFWMEDAKLNAMAAISLFQFSEESTIVASVDKICVFCQGKDEDPVPSYADAYDRRGIDDDRMSLSDLSVRGLDYPNHDLALAHEENWSIQRHHRGSPSTTLTRRGSDARVLERELHEALYESSSLKYPSDVERQTDDESDEDDDDEEEINPAAVGIANALSTSGIDFRPGHARKKSDTGRGGVPASLKHLIQRLEAEGSEMPASSGGLVTRRPTLHRIRRPASTIQINAVAVNHLKALLSQVLHEFHIGNPAEWEPVFINLMLKVSESLHPDVKSGDSPDPNTYVKIKRIPGGLPSDSMYIDGVVFSKSVPHKLMPVPIANPQILLLAFALEYRPVEAAETVDLSIEAVVSQEKEHAQKLIARILTLKPDLVLVERGVSRYSMEYLLEARVTVIANVKPSVMESIARSTQADIVTFEKLAQSPRLGTCRLFRMQTYFHPDIPRHRKSFLLFEGARKEVGCTLVLRGRPADELGEIKTLARFMIQVAYNLRLETSLLQDEFALLPTSVASVAPAPVIEDENTNTRSKKSALEKSIQVYEKTILSSSPNVIIPPPYTLSKQRELAARTPSHRNVGASSPLPPLAPISIRPGMENGHHEIDELTLSPFDYQSIIVLRSTSGGALTTPCHPPEYQTFDYYGESDIPLGRYIERVYMLSSYLCRCERPWLNHVRSYAHGEGKVNVILQTLACPIAGMDESILMWSECRICHASTQPVPMSEDTWAFSFGKYLELTFYHTGIPCRANLCPHDIHRCHVRWFAYRGLGIKVEYSRIDLYEVIFPSMKLEWDARVHEQNKEEDRDALHTRIDRLYASIRKRFQSLLDHDREHNQTTQNIHQFKERRSQILSLQRQAAGDRRHMLQVLQRAFTNSAKDDTFALSVVYHELLSNVTRWDAIFAKIFGISLTPNEKRSLAITNSSKLAVTIPPPLPPRETQTDMLPVLGTSPSREAMDVFLKAHALPDPANLEVVELKDWTPKHFKDPSTKRFLHNTDAIDQVLLVAPSDIFPMTQEVLAPTPFLPVNVLDALDTKTPASKAPLGERHFFVPSGCITESIADERIGGPQFEWTVPRDDELEEFDEETHGDEDESAGITGQLQYPWSPFEHVHPDSPVILREDEPSSIIAFTLRSKQYQAALAAMRSGASVNAEGEKPICVEFDDIGGEAGKLPDGSQVKFNCQVFYAEEFEELRAACGIEKLYIESLARCFKYDSSGGKSRMLFLKTRDTRFMIKQLNRAEREAFEHFAPMYLEHMSRAANTKLPTALAKIFGFYTIKIKHTLTNKSTRLDLFVMEDLFFGREDIKVFDLKGSEWNRHVQSTGKRGEVFLDLNFVEYIYESPLFLREHSKRMLRACVFNDTIFLSKQGVMDYSLLVGVDQKRQELVVGIVDFIRTFTWDKRLESVVKESGLLGGGGKQPTIVKPKVYKKRFRNSMESYFLCVPDKHAVSTYLN